MFKFDLIKSFFNKRHAFILFISTLLFGNCIVVPSGNQINHLDDNIISVKEFGAKGDGISDDTKAIKNAIAYLSKQQVNRNRYNNTSTKVYIGFVPKLFFPAGIYKISNSIDLGHYQNIVGDNAILIPSHQGEFPAMKGIGWQLNIEGLQFVGFHSGIFIDNKNLDIGKINISNCTFAGLDVCISLAAQSSMTIINNNRFIDNKKVLIIESGDKVIFSENWISSGKLSDKHDAQIINNGTLHFIRNLLVPQKPENNAYEPAWINNYRNVDVEGVRQGGESGSFTLINNFSSCDIEYPYVPTFVRVNNSECYGVFGNRSDYRQPSVLRLFSIPNSIELTNLKGLTDSYLMQLSEDVDCDNFNQVILALKSKNLVNIKISNIVGGYYLHNNQSNIPSCITEDFDEKK